jgi:hypothetical protein
MNNLFKTAYALALGLTTTVFTTAVAAGCVSVANLTKVEGQVSIKPAGKVVRVSPGPLPQALCSGDEVLTFAGRAKVDDGRSTAVLENFSSLVVTAQGASVKGGDVLFDVRKRGPEHGVTIKTRLSVIGVKGTRFLVSDRADQVRIAMDEGEVEVTSTQGPVSLYREKTGTPEASTIDIQADFARFVEARLAGVAATVADFNLYKAKTERDFVAYVEHLNLSAQRELIMHGTIAIERDNGAEASALIKTLRHW